MKKRSSPAITPTAFSIARQFTGPPFSVTLESAELRRHLMEEMLQPAGLPAGGEAGQARARNLAAKPPARAGKAPAKRRKKKPKK